MEFFRVFLKSPLNEKLICYTLNLQEAVSIDPDPNIYFICNPEEVLMLEASEYYVTQVKKDHLEDNDLIAIAIELQKEALWNRLKLDNKLYLRTLANSSSEDPAEDISAAMQLWRPVISNKHL